MDFKYSALRRKLKIMEEKEKEKFWYEAGFFITKKGIRVTLYREVK
jgi:hypothetical protein